MGKTERVKRKRERFNGTIRKASLLSIEKCLAAEHVFRCSCHRHDDKKNTVHFIQIFLVIRTGRWGVDQVGMNSWNELG